MLVRAILPRVLATCAFAVTLLMAGPATAQEPRCPEPWLTLEDLKERFLELAADGRERSARG